MSDAASARYQQAQREQKEWREFSLEQFVPAEAPVRAVWAFVVSLDLSAFYAGIRAVEGGPGRDPIDPRILLALWLHATVEGIGSARLLDRLCQRDLSFMWLCGNVSVNYHTLADFRTRHVQLLDQLLTQSIASLLQAGLVELKRVAQDGMRVRASAGNSSFRRRGTLQKHLADAEEQIAALKQELEENGDGGKTRLEAARLHAAQERAERIQQALAEREKVAANMEKRKKGSGEQARASITDPEARVMKMGDGGFRPAYNVQLATTTDTQMIVAVEVVNAGTDGGQLGPMLQQIADRYERLPEEYLADGGFVKLEDITRAEAAGVTVYMPVMEEEKKRAQGVDPFAPLKGDTPEVARWRARMGTDLAKEIYKERAASAELSNAGCRNRRMQQIPVRGLLKAKAIALWHALSHNFLRQLGLTAKLACG